MFKHWLRRNKWRIAFALVIGFTAFIIALPAMANLPRVGAMPVVEPKTCDLRLSELDLSKAVAVISVDAHEAYDTILVFVFDGETVIATAKNNCIISAS